MKNYNDMFAKLRLLGTGIEYIIEEYDMGYIIDEKSLNYEERLINRLLIYFHTIKTIYEPKSISSELANELLACKPNRRSMKLEQIFNTVLDRYSDGVIIKDIDVMFNPEYQVDVLKILIEARKRKKYSVIWPGRFENGKLIYAEEGYSDYKVYEIENYDVTCVIGGDLNEVFRTDQL